MTTMLQPAADGVPVVTDVPDPTRRYMAVGGTRAPVDDGLAASGVDDTAEWELTRVCTRRRRSRVARSPTQLR